MAVSSEERVVWEAEFDPRVRTYWLFSGLWILTATVIGIVLLPIWLVGGFAITGPYLRRMKCTLTERSLEFKKGALVRVEKTVPLEKITDLGLVQGPIMRMLGIEALSVETAGQSSQGALLKLIGIVEARQFRDGVLEQRDRLVAALASEPGSPVEPRASEPISETVLEDIRDTLHRIEGQLARDGDA